MAEQKKKPPFPSGFLFLALLVVGFLIMAQLASPPLQKAWDYSVFLRQVKQGNVVKVEIDGNKLSGKYLDGKQQKEFTVYVPDDPDLMKALKSHGVEIQVKQPPPAWLVSYLPQIIMVLIFVGFFWMAIRQAQSGSAQALSFGKSRAKVMVENKPKVSFKDVAGAEEAKEELLEVVEFLKSPKRFQVLGAKIPKGALLLGPPGTGKTLLARAVAGEARVPFIHISGSDFVEMFVGVGASRVRDLFEQAKRHAPCLVFIDELDAVGRQRGTGLGGGHDEREQTLNQLLVEMDGFEPNQGVIVIAATNRPDVLDPALLRPGRFDRRIVVDKPDLKGRKEILDVHGKGKPLGEDVDFEVLARGTPGFSGADLANLINEGALLAARRDKDKIGMKELEEAKERVMAGPERRSRIISDKEKETVAYHESGHALVAKLLPDADPVHKISILPRGMALGYTMQLPVEDRYLMKKSEIIDHITVMLGGRCAEELVFGEVTTGAHDDLEKATEFARRMVCDYGMSDALGPIALGRKHDQVFLGRDLFNDRNYSESVAAQVDREIRKIVEGCYQRAKTLLSENREKLNHLASVLVEKESLEGEELETFFKEILEGEAPLREGKEIAAG